MPRTTRPKRPVRARLLLAPVAICAAAARAASQDPADHCIAAAHAIGCVSERSIIELTAARKDAGTLQQLVQDKLASGQCRLLDYGERVQVTSTHGSERTQVRPRGAQASYWIPSSWARPATECEGTPSASALHQKLGLPDERRHEPDDDTRVTTFTDQRTPPPRWDDDDERRGDARHDARRDADRPDGYRRDAERYEYEDRRYEQDEERYADSPSDRPPPGPSRPLPSSRYAHRCDFKPVMTDADLAACRTLSR